LLSLTRPLLPSYLPDFNTFENGENQSLRGKPGLQDDRK